MLEISSLRVFHGAVEALRGVDLTVAEGSLTAIIGPNGAGKSTLIDTASGLIRPREGRIRFEGRDLAGRDAAEVARAGLLQVPEGRRVLGPLSVEENLRLGALAARGRAAPPPLAEIWSLFPVLAERRNQLAGSLSGGQQQMLAIGRALMGRPRLLMLDEPSLGLAPIVVARVFDVLRDLARGGLTILLVEQNARLALEAADVAHVLEGGRIVRSGPGRDLAGDPEIAAHYLPDFSRASLGRPDINPRTPS